MAICRVWLRFRSGDREIRLGRSTNGGAKCGAVTLIRNDASGVGADQYGSAVTVAPVRRAVVTLRDKRFATFDTRDARFGHDVDHDAVSGLLSALKAHAGFASAACVVNNLAASTLVATREPTPGDRYGYLFHADGPNGVGAFGGGPAARPNIRDALDESLATCA